MKPISEESLIAQLQSQDRAAIGEIYDRYSPALFGIALRIVGSPDAAKDVLQDAFVKIWRNGPSYDPARGRLFTWLLNIVRNTAIDATRSGSFRLAEKTIGPDSLVNKSITGLAPEHIGLRKLVEQLDPKHRQLVDLLYFQGFTQAEAEKELSIPIGTIKTRLRAAINELRKAFADAPTAALAGLLAVLEAF